ncbi:hypothetical protein B0H13DRAFT_2381540 [Mycena leptocephala]|nr:hypothetical protein B0H13DRAFT_2381540 [Mycena leptocephala]
MTRKIVLQPNEPCDIGFHPQKHEFFGDLLHAAVCSVTLQIDSSQSLPTREEIAAYIDVQDEHVVEQLVLRDLIKPSKQKIHWQMESYDLFGVDVDKDFEIVPTWTIHEWMGAILPRKPKRKVQPEPVAEVEVTACPPRCFSGGTDLLTPAPSFDRDARKKIPTISIFTVAVVDLNTETVNKQGGTAQGAMPSQPPPYLRPPHPLRRYHSRVAQSSGTYGPGQSPGARSQCLRPSTQPVLPNEDDSSSDVEGLERNVDPTQRTTASVPARRYPDVNTLCATLFITFRLRHRRESAFRRRYMPIVPPITRYHLVTLKDIPIPDDNPPPIFGLRLSEDLYYFCGRCGRGYASPEILNAHQKALRSLSSRPTKVSHNGTRTHFTNSRYHRVFRVDPRKLPPPPPTPTSRSVPVKFISLPILPLLTTEYPLLQRCVSDQDLFLDREGWGLILLGFQAYSSPSRVAARKPHIVKLSSFGQQKLLAQVGPYLESMAGFNTITDESCAKYGLFLWRLVFNLLRQMRGEGARNLSPQRLQKLRLKSLANTIDKDVQQKDHELMSTMSSTRSSPSQRRQHADKYFNAVICFAFLPVSLTTNLRDRSAQLAEIMDMIKQDPKLSFTDAYNKLKIFLIDGQETPFSFLYNNHNLLKVIRSDERAAESAQWLNQEGTALQYAGKVIQVGRFKDAYTQLRDEYLRIVKEDIWMGYPPPAIPEGDINPSQLIDDPANRSPGFCFLDNLENKFTSTATFMRTGSFPSPNSVKNSHIFTRASSFGAPDLAWNFSTLLTAPTMSSIRPLSLAPPLVNTQIIYQISMSHRRPHENIPPSTRGPFFYNPSPIQTCRSPGPKSGDLPPFQVFLTDRLLGAVEARCFHEYLHPRVKGNYTSAELSRKIADITEAQVHSRFHITNWRKIVGTIIRKRGDPLAFEISKMFYFDTAAQHSGSTANAFTAFRPPTNVGKGVPTGGLNAVVLHLDFIRHADKMQVSWSKWEPRDDYNPNAQIIWAVVEHTEVAKFQIGRLDRLFLDEIHRLLTDSHYRDVFLSFASLADHGVQIFGASTTMPPILMPAMQKLSGINSWDVIRMSVARKNIILQCYDPPSVSVEIGPWDGTPYVEPDVRPVDEAPDIDAHLGWDFKPSNVKWLDPDVSSEVAEFPQGIRLTEKNKFYAFHRVTGCPSQFPFFRPRTGFLINLTDMKDMNRDGEVTVVQDQLIRDQDSHSWGRSTGARSKVDAYLPGSFFGLSGDVKITCRRAAPECGGVTACESLDPAFLKEERRELDPEDIRILVAASLRTREMQDDTKVDSIIPSKAGVARVFVGMEHNVMGPFVCASQTHRFAIRATFFYAPNEARRSRLARFTRRCARAEGSLTLDSERIIDEEDTEGTCSRVVSGRTGSKGKAICSFNHHKNGLPYVAKVEPLTCTAKMHIYCPWETLHPELARMAIVVPLPDSGHSHPPPPKNKCTHAIAERYRECVRKFGPGASVNKVENAQSTKDLLGGKTPSLFHPGLISRDTKARIIQEVKAEWNELSSTAANTRQQVANYLADQEALALAQREEISPKLTVS